MISDVITLTKNLTGFAIFSIWRSFRAHVHAFCVQKNLKFLVEGWYPRLEGWYQRYQGKIVFIERSIFCYHPPLLISPSTFDITLHLFGVHPKKVLQYGRGRLWRLLKNASDWNLFLDSTYISKTNISIMGRNFYVRKNFLF